MRTVTFVALATATLAFAATVATAQVNAGSMPERNMPMGLGLPKPKEKDPNEKTAYQKAKDLLAADKFEEAVATLQDVVRDDPRNDDAWHDLGYGNERLKHTGEAVGYYERALAIRAARKDTHWRLGALQLALKNLPKAEEQLGQLKTLCTTSCDELKNLESDIAAYKAANPS